LDFKNRQRWFKLKELERFKFIFLRLHSIEKGENTLAYFDASLLMNELSELQKHTDIVQIRRVKENKFIFLPASFNRKRGKHSSLF
jgi:hypothetical protein